MDMQKNYPEQEEWEEFLEGCERITLHNAYHFAATDFLLGEDDAAYFLRLKGAFTKWVYGQILWISPNKTMFQYNVVVLIGYNVYEIKLSSQYYVYTKATNRNFS